MDNGDKTKDRTFRASEFKVKHWIDADGKEAEQIKLADLHGKFKVIYCFQSWCRGCHGKGFPDLKKMVEELEGNQKVVFLAVQTVFEGFESNTYEKIIEIQKQYGLKIPFGHDAGDDGKSRSNIMDNYMTGGTPWFIFIDKNDIVVFADLYINVDGAIEFLKHLE